MPMPSSCGPTLAPLPASVWQIMQFFSNTLAPSAASGFAAKKPCRRAASSSWIFWSAGGRPFVSFARRSLMSGILLPSSGVSTAFSCSSRADALPAATASSSFSPPSLLPARAAAMAVCKRAGAVGKACSSNACVSGLLAWPSSFCRRLPQFDRRVRVGQHAAGRRRILDGVDGHQRPEGRLAVPRMAASSGLPPAPSPYPPLSPA